MLEKMPAMTAGHADHVWSLEEIVNLLEEAEPKGGKRGPTRSELSNEGSYYSATVDSEAKQFHPAISRRSTGQELRSMQEITNPLYSRTCDR